MNSRSHNVDGIPRPTSLVMAEKYVRSKSSRDGTGITCLGSC